MHTTVYIDYWRRVPEMIKERVYLSDHYPGLPESEFDGCGYEQDDTGRHYETLSVHDNPNAKVHFLSGFWPLFSEQLELPTAESGIRVNASEVDEVLSSVLILLNSASRLRAIAEQVTTSDSMQTPAISIECTKLRATEFISMLQAARKTKNGIYWRKTEAELPPPQKRQCAVHHLFGAKESVD